MKLGMVVIYVFVSAGCSSSPRIEGGPGAAPGQQSFNISSLHATYPLVAELRGTYTIFSDSLVVLVDAGRLQSHVAKNYGAQGILSELALRVALGEPTATGWALDTLGTQVQVAGSLAPEGSVPVPQARFVLPIPVNSDLSERWLVFQLRANHNGLFNVPGPFANYACAPDNLHGRTAASESRARRMKTEYSKAC